MLSASQEAESNSMQRDSEVQILFGILRECGPELSDVVGAGLDGGHFLRRENDMSHIRRGRDCEVFGASDGRPVDLAFPVLNFALHR